jgi:hypothetical protein
MKHILLICTILCSISFTLDAEGAESAGPLPQDQPYQKVLRQSLAKLEVTDFTIPSSQFIHDKTALESRTNDELYRLWIGDNRGFGSLAAPPGIFLLSEIEKKLPGTVPFDPEVLAWWSQFSLPGNPFAESRPVKMRAFAMAAANIMLMDRAWHRKEIRQMADLLSGNIMIWAYTFLHVCDVVDPPVADAYLAGLERMVAVMLKLAPRDINTNMDCKELIVLMLMDHIHHGDAAKQSHVAEARRILFGAADRNPANSDGKKGIFHPAGYIGEMDGPEASYNGIALFHLADAALGSRGDPGWDAFMPEVIERMIRFKAYNTFPDPDGCWNGSSSWAKRTNNGYPRDQRGRYWRDLAAGMLTDEALYLVPRATKWRDRPDGMILPDRATLLALHEHKTKILNQKFERTLAASKSVKPAKPLESKWPADLVYTYDYYIPGSYDRLLEKCRKGNTLLSPPFARDADFNICFDGEFWIAKQRGWGFQVESVPDMGRGYDEGGSGALAGGSLATFWSKATGSVILGKLPAKWNHVTWDGVADWTTHHLWGRGADGNAFSSARNRKPEITYDDPSNPKRVTAVGAIGADGSKRANPKSTLTGEVRYERAFQMRENGLHVTSVLHSDETDTLTELWETLPVFLRDGRDQKDLPDTAIELRVKDSWLRVVEAPGADKSKSTAAGQLVGAVEAVRLTRFGASVVIRFDQPQRVKPAAEVWAGGYQSSNRIRNLHIDLLGSGGKAVRLPAQVKVSYEITGAN